jgi:hypothetical protein
VTVPQVRAVFTELLHEPAAGPARIAEVVSAVLRRSETARIYHWHAATDEFLEPRDKREPVSSVRTEPLDMAADRALGPGRTPNGLDARSFLAWSNFEVQDVA